MDRDTARTTLIAVLVMTSAAAFFIRLKFVLSYPLWPDEALYAWYARRVAFDPGFLFSKDILEYHPPLYPLLLAPLHWTAHAETAMRALNALINLAGVLLIHRIGRLLKDEWTGVFAAVILAFHYLYTSMAPRILIDGPLSVVFMAFVLCWIRRGENPSSKRDTLLTAAGCASILLKWSGALVIPLFLCLSLLPGGRQTTPERRKNAARPLAAMAGIFLCLLFWHFFRTGHPLPEVSALKGLYLAGPPWYYLTRLHNVLMIPYLVPFFLIGILLLLREGGRIQRGILVWFFVMFVAVSLAREKALRYSLLFLPPAVLITSAGVYGLADILFKKSSLNAVFKRGAIVILLATFAFLYPKTSAYLIRQNAGFRGLSSAGEWIKNNAGPDTLVAASSPRIVRYYSGLNGDIKRLPPDKASFKQWLSGATGTVIVEVDAWEPAGRPEWLYPVTDQVIAMMRQMGFRLAERIEVDTADSDGRGGQTPAVYLFEKAPEGKP